MMIIHALALAAITALSPDYFAVHKINASFLKAGASLNIVGSYKTGMGEPMEGFEYIALRTYSKITASSELGLIL